MVTMARTATGPTPTPTPTLTPTRTTGSPERTLTTIGAMTTTLGATSRCLPPTPAFPGLCRHRVQYPRRQSAWAGARVQGLRGPTPCPAPPVRAPLSSVRGLRLSSRISKSEKKRKEKGGSSFMCSFLVVSHTPSTANSPQT